MPTAISAESDIDPRRMKRPRKLHIQRNESHPVPTRPHSATLSRAVVILSAVLVAVPLLSVARQKPAMAQACPSGEFADERGICVPPPPPGYAPPGPVAPAPPGTSGALNGGRSGSPGNSPGGANSGAAGRPGTGTLAGGGSNGADGRSVSVRDLGLPPPAPPAGSRATGAGSTPTQSTAGRPQGGQNTTTRPSGGSSAFTGSDLAASPLPVDPCLSASPAPSALFGMGSPSAPPAADGVTSPSPSGPAGSFAIPGSPCPSPTPSASPSPSPSQIAAAPSDANPAAGSGSWLPFILFVIGVLLLAAVVLRRRKLARRRRAGRGRGGSHSLR